MFIAAAFIAAAIFAATMVSATAITTGVESTSSTTVKTATTSTASECVVREEQSCCNQQDLPGRLHSRYLLPERQYMLEDEGLTWAPAAYVR
jgi:hypothetical protein